MDSEQQSRGAATGVWATVMRRPEVLLEAPEGAEGSTLWEFLADSGYNISWCPGPCGPPQSWCPLLSGHRCTLVESADVVVSALGFHDLSCRQVLEELGRLHPEVEVIVETPPSEAVQWERLLEGHLVLPTPLSKRALLEDVDAVLSRSVVGVEDGVMGKKES